MALVVELFFLRYQDINDQAREEPEKQEKGYHGVYSNPTNCFQIMDEFHTQLLNYVRLLECRQRLNQLLRVALLVCWVLGWNS